MNPFEIIQFELGPMANYIYLIGDPSTRKATVVDPAWDVDAIRAKAEAAGYQIESALITHGHPDHTNGIAELLKTHDIPIYVSEHEASFYKPCGDAIRDLKDQDQVKVGGLEVQCLLTPGHTPGSQCFLFHGQLVAGDTLFIDACGRCDLPGGNAEELYDSLYNRLMKLPDDTILYPGHNYNRKKTDTLANQKTTNPHLKCGSLAGFLSGRS